jgi:hypothetical protein
MRSKLPLPFAGGFEVKYKISNPRIYVEGLELDREVSLLATARLSVNHSRYRSISLVDPG